MKYPNKEKSEELLNFVASEMLEYSSNEAAVRNFKNHSINTSKIASKIGSCYNNLDMDKLENLALIHDIGRHKYEVKDKRNHAIIGYNYAMEKGFEELARISITHNFPAMKFQENDIARFFNNEDDIKFCQNYLNSIEFDTYDKIIALSDFMAGIDGFITVEDRFDDIFNRYQHLPKETLLYGRKTVLDLKEVVEKEIGVDIYKLLGI